MCSICSSFRILAPHWRSKSVPFLISLHSKRKTSFFPSIISPTSDDSLPTARKGPLHYDPSEELFRLDVALKPRNDGSGAPAPPFMFWSKWTNTLERYATQVAGVDFIVLQRVWNRENQIRRFKI